MFMFIAGFAVASYVQFKYQLVEKALLKYELYKAARKAP